MAELNEIKEIKDPKKIKGDKEDYDPTKKREVIKTALIIFLAVLLVLTFFSNTIMNKSLAEITTERTTSGKLTERIRGSGMIESNQSYGVSIDGNKVIDKIMVKVGQDVKKDDVLFTVGTGESEELTAAEDALKTLKLSYEKAMLTLPADYTSENQEIKNARDDLANAVAKRDQAVANQGNVQSAKNNYNYNKTQLSYYTKLQTKLTGVIEAIDTDVYISAPAEYTGELISLKSAYDDALTAYNNAYAVYSALAGAAADDKAPAAEEGDISAAKADADEKEFLMNSARDSYNNAKSSLRSDLSSQLTDAENNIDRYTALIAEYEENNAGGSMTIDDLNADVSAKQRALETLITTLEKTKQTDENQNKLDRLDLEAMRSDIERAQKKVDKLKEENETTEIKSKYDGVVSSINLRAGDETTPGSDIINIDIADEGYTVKITIDGEKTKKVKKGTAAEVVNNWGGGIEAVLTDIKNDTQAGSKNRILVFSVTGDVSSGSYLDLSIPCGSGNYDCIVPKSAVNEDKDGKFVLTVTSKSSPLGNRYYAERVPVDILASDEVSCAVSGSIQYNSYVIVAASKPVSPKDQVRMKDK